MSNLKAKKTIFLTGVTGLVGSYLTKVLLENNYFVYCLARAQKESSAVDRVRNILTFWEKDILLKCSGNLTVLDGDITKKDFGLEKNTVLMIKERIEEVFHCAAITKFNLPIDEIRKVNVEGTKNVFDFALQCKVLRKVNHMSTAFVCGDHKGAFTENDLDAGQKFNSTYEQSKFEAEIIANQYRRNRIWIDVFRPPFVLGDSVTGKIPIIQSFHQTVQLWRSHIFEVFPGKNLVINLIPVDALANGIFAISRNSMLKNRNYHIFDQRGFLLEDILRIASEVVNFKQPRLISFSEFNRLRLTPIQKILLRRNISLFNPKVELKSIITNEILNKHKFVLPSISNKTLSKLIKSPLSTPDVLIS